MQNINLFKEYEGVFQTENVEENSDTKQKKERVYAYKPFNLQNAIGEKSAKKVWIEYQKLRLAGIVAEELIFNIVSKIRDMLVIKSFGAQKWKEEDLKKFYTKLVEIYHRSRMEEGRDLDIAIEKTILNI
ncbi:MAG: hypothetical protein AAB672_02135 [Patescibacteria group bacterium]